MGIFCDVRPHIQRLTVFFQIAVYYCICCNGLFEAILLRSFYFPNFLHLDCEIYSDITLLSASTVDSIYDGFYIVVCCRVALARAAPLASEEDTEAVPQVFPGDEPAWVEELRRTSALCVDAPYERIRPASKVKIYVRLSVCLCQIFAHQFNL